MKHLCGLEEQDLLNHLNLLNSLNLLNHLNQSTPEK
jgi:hypothetical protein